jgi:hypothetical protein
MHKQPPPPQELLARAAELRVAGAMWTTIAREVNRAVRTVYYWPRKYPDQWFAALLQAERFLTANADCVSVQTLRGLLTSGSENLRWHAARTLIARRIDRDRLERQTPAPSQPAPSPQAELIAFLDGHSDEELTDIAAVLAPDLAPATEADEVQPPAESHAPLA